jgi:hypothetical protein
MFYSIHENVEYCIRFTDKCHSVICCCFTLQQVKQGESERTFATFWPIVLYHVSFFIFITTIGLNIIFGIIVDTFSELRDLKVILSNPNLTFEMLGSVSQLKS